MANDSLTTATNGDCKVSLSLTSRPLRIGVPTVSKNPGVTKRMLALAPAVVVPGHGPVSRDVARDLTLTRDYLTYLRETMGRAVDDLTPFDDAYSRTDWSRYAALPAFEPANRINAWGTYLRMEQEALNGAK